MKANLLFLLLLITSAAFAQSYSGPESVTYHSGSKRYFISNNGSNQVLARDSAGTLSVFTSAISSGPHGLEIVGNTLFVCDGSSMKGFDLTSGNSVMNLNVGATFLNGICTDGNNYLYATDFSAKKIFKIDIAAQTYTTFVTGLAKSPNGIIYDGVNQRIVWVTWGTNAPIMQAMLADSSVSQVVATTLGNCDGIVRDGNNNYYVSAWSSQSVHRFDSTFLTTPVAVVTGLSNPADIYYNLDNDSLVSPNSGNNTVTFHFLGTTSPTALEQIADNSFSAFPNPAHNELFIDNGQSEIERIEIWNLLGEKVLSQETHIGTSLLQLDISQLGSGIYIVKLSANKKIKTKSIVVTK